MAIVHLSDFSYFAGHYAYAGVGLSMMQPTLSQNQITCRLIVLVALFNVGHLDNMYR